MSIIIGPMIVATDGSLIDTRCVSERAVGPGVTAAGAVGAAPVGPGGVGGTGGCADADPAIAVAAAKAMAIYKL